jgi:integrase
MGHADIKTTMRYLHHRSHADEARLLAGAFTTE